MAKTRYRMTATARAQLTKIVADTRAKWGTAQAEKYLNLITEGLNRTAEEYAYKRSPHREDLAEGSGYLLHQIERHYVAFQRHDPDTILVAGFFYQGMDIPNRLREMRTQSRQEIAALKQEIEREYQQDIDRDER